MTHRRRRRHLANHLAAMLVRAFGGEAGAGILLLACAAMAMLAANSPWAHGWHGFWHGPLAWTPMAALPDLGHWIDDVAMAMFFFVVGLEIKREALDGDLAHPALRRLPVLAAAMGMAAPALVYLAVGGGRADLAHGWAIPAATDIAFALGVLALAGKGLPGSLRLFLLGIAVVDDLGAVAIIAVFYGGDLAVGWLLAAAGVLAGLILLNRMRVGSPTAYLAGTMVLWACVFHSGVHPTVAGVAGALTVPLALDRGGNSPLLRLEHALSPWCSYLVLPLFALASAGVPLAGMFDGGAASLTLAAAVAAGLIVGKQAGVLGAVLLAERTGFARRPGGTTLRQLWGASWLAGIGFTMSLFIAGLAFPGAPDLAAQARLGILAGSLVSALGGFVVLRRARGAGGD